MNKAEEVEAWLEGEGTQHLLLSDCSLGRAALNTIVLASPRVSRLHAIIHLEGGSTFWLIDLGSSNGTFLNKRRIREPARLSDEDRILIGGTAFTFHRPPENSAARLTVPPPTLQELENVPCWLVVADIKDFTLLSRKTSSEQLASLVSRWLGQCKELIEEHRGMVNKYLGDGILAYWRDYDCGAEDIALVIGALKNLQAHHDPVFRFVVHFGLVGFGGVASIKEETLMGTEVNLAFRLEKLAARLNESCGISDTAHERLQSLVAARQLGEYELKGFEGKRPLFSV